MRRILMDIYTCQKKAEELGYDSTVFEAIFPGGRYKFRWLDAYM